MVDCSLLDLDQIDREVRREIIRYVVERKGIRPPALGVTINYISMVLSGKVKAGDGLLCNALKFIDDQELSLLLKGIIPERKASLSGVVREPS
ncbi:hypothetical protein [Caldivirga sp.]|uniref:hypothetical protein n=1 Tax=Caldivirga sp. TaxID=2080243 RepID=UPI003D0BD6C7